MMLVADSGSTRTTWILANEAGKKELIHTSGINPMYQDEQNIYSVLLKEFKQPVVPQSVYFYGAGCINNDVNTTVRNALMRFFKCREVLVSTDLVAAARSLCGRYEGIACILGTGSNSCYYNGTEIVKNVSPLGFMLGDEGSGAVIGKRLVADILKNQLPGEICNLFFSSYQISRQQIMENVYKKPFPNRFLAQFTRFIYDHPEYPALKDIVRTGFTEFFERNIRQYPEADRLPVHFTGSVAFYFLDLLTQAAEKTGFRIGTVTQSPVHDLIQYHMENSEK